MLPIFQKFLYIYLAVSCSLIPSCSAFKRTTQHRAAAVAPCVSTGRLLVGVVTLPHATIVLWLVFFIYDLGVALASSSC